MLCVPTLIHISCSYFYTSMLLGGTPLHTVLLLLLISMLAVNNKFPLVAYGRTSYLTLPLEARGVWGAAWKKMWDCTEEGEVKEKCWAKTESSDEEQGRLPPTESSSPFLILYKKDESFGTIYVRVFSLSVCCQGKWMLIAQAKPLGG